MEVMPKCNKCSETFPNRTTIDGKRYNLYTRKYCLKCSPFGKHNTRKMEITKDFCVCESCNRKFEYNRDKGHQYKTCNSCLVNTRWTKIKHKAVEYLGGACVACGYNKCIKAMDFHHREADHKEFSIGGNYNRSWEKIKSELDKCTLVCCRCHREHHDGLINLVQYVK